MATKTFNTSDALARASAAAAQKMAPKAPPLPADGVPAAPELVQFNVKLPADLRRKFRAIAFAWNTTEREMLEAFIAQLPDVVPPPVAAPDAVAWAKPPREV